MTTSRAAERPEPATAPPYTVLIEATHVRDELASYVVSVRPYVDLGLSAGECRALTDVAARMKLNAAALVERTLLAVGLLGVFIGAGLSFYLANAAFLIWFLIGGLLTGTGLALNRHVRIGRDRLEALVGELTAAGVLAPTPFDKAKVRDLQRIQSSLDTVRKRGVADEDCFRAAARKVVQQDRHRPTLKHIAIADSEGSDPATRKIRKLVKDQRRAWKADVAAAELAVLDLAEMVRRPERTPARG